MEAIGQMAGGIAHDFNNALASMLGYTKLALEGVPEGIEVREDLTQVLKGGERARQLVDQLLAFSRQKPRESGKAPEKLAEIVKETLKLIRPIVPTTIDIETHLEEAVPPVLVDAGQIHQVLVNLCMNAAQAMPEGGKLTIDLKMIDLDRRKVGEVPGSVAKRRLKPGRYGVISIEDKGVGMSREILPKIFEPFFTTKKFGAGMGLAIVYGIVKAHDGEISVYSEPGIGTSVQVYLPVAQSGDIAVQVERPKRAPGGSESILVVDDEEVLGRMVGRTLSKLGYRVTVKSAAHEALEEFRAAPQSFDLVVSDQTMPKMTGDRLAEELQRIRPGLPVVLCSGFSEILTPEREKQVRPFAIVRKPFEGDELEHAIRRALDAANEPCPKN